MPCCIKFFSRYSQMWMHMFTWNRERLNRMVEQCSLTSISNFVALTMWTGRLQMQKESCRTLNMMVKRKDGIGTSMLQSTKKSTQWSRALFIMATMEWTKVPKSDNIFKESRVLRGSGQCCLGPTREVWQGFWCNCVLSYSDGHKEGLNDAIHPYV